MRYPGGGAFWAVAAATVLFTTTGCDMFDNPYQKTGPEQTAAASRELTQLPSLEDTETQLHAAVEQLGAFASRLAPGLTWQWVDRRSVELCDAPYDQTNGSKVSLPHYISTPGIPDAVWPQVLDYARQLAAHFGATGIEVFADQPGNHTVRFYSRANTELFLGSRGAVIGTDTGCRLPAPQNPTPPPPTTPR